MRSPKIFFQPGWILEQPSSVVEDDPITGEPIINSVERIEGTGLLQESLWSGVAETNTRGVRDERLVMFAPTTVPITTVNIEANAVFHAPDTSIWQAITDGFLRGIPGQLPEYIAVRVRRAKEKETQ